MKNAATAAGKAAAKSFVVVYRVGGFARFTWRRALPVATYEEAAAQVADLTRMGYTTLAPQDYDRSMAVGLPETFEVSR